MKKVFSSLLLIIFAIAAALTVYAHPGRTDGAGGHTNHSTGEYHYHHGYSAHDHTDMDGDGVRDCPYEFVDKTDHSNKGSTYGSSNSISKPKQEYQAPTWDFEVSVVEFEPPIKSDYVPTGGYTRTTNTKDNTPPTFGESLFMGFMAIFMGFGVGTMFTVLTEKPLSFIFRSKWGPNSFMSVFWTLSLIFCGVFIYLLFFVAEYS
jgi:hypothetical protein